MSNLSPRQMDALDRIQNKPALQPFFFKKLKGLKWFDELESRGFFNPPLNPEPVESDQEGYFRHPSWPILDYLEQTALELRQPENDEYADRFLKIIRGVTDNAKASGIGNYRTWWYFAKIFEFIPVEKITNDDMRNVEYWLKDPFDSTLVGAELGKHLLPNLLASDSDHGNRLAVDLVSALTELTWNSVRWGNIEDLNVTLPVKAYFSRKKFSAHGRTIGEKLEENGVNIFRGRLSEILERTNKDQYSTIWRPAIEDHEQNKDRDDAEDILVSAMRDALLGFVDSHENVAIEYVKQLLDSEKIIFQRIAIYVTGVYNRKLRELNTKIMNPQFFAFHYQHEMHQMLENCFIDFDEKEKQKAIGIIRNVAEQSKDPDQPNDVQEKQQAYTWLTWLSAIRGKGCQQAEDLYAENLAITNDEPEHPDFSSYMEVVDWEGDSSPYSLKELLSRDFDDLIEILRSFEGESIRGAPSRRGLAQTLKEALKVRPELFVGNLTKFLTLDNEYKCYLIEGYKELWREKQHDNWAELLEFCWDLLRPEGFWMKCATEQNETMYSSTHRIVGLISELIKEGIIDDNNAFHPSMLPIAERIIERILENQKGESFTGRRDSVRDAVFISINSPRGKCIGTLINYALRRCRLSDKIEKRHDELWINELRPIFDRQIQLVQDGNYEFVTLFSNYLPNFLYLNRSWTLEQLPTVFNKENRLGWTCAMQGYVYVNKIYSEVYQFLRENGHLRDALDSEELESRGKSKLIQNIAIAYLRGDERYDDEVGDLGWLINRWQLDEIQQLIWFFWTVRGGKEEVDKKLIPLWMEISRRINTQNEIDKHILSGLCMWSVFIDELNDQTMELLFQSGPYADVEHNSYILIEELKRLVGSYPDQVADIFIRMLEDFAPTHMQEDIEYIVSKLYETETRQKANTICDKYIEYGIEFPAKIRERYLHY